MAGTLEPEPMPQEELLGLEPEPETQTPMDQYDRYGLVLGCEHAVVYPNEHTEVQKEAIREVKWVKMLGAWGDYYGNAAVTRRRSAKLKRRVRKGIPVAHRGRAWFLLCNAYTAMEAAHGEYQTLAFSEPCPEKVEQQIRLDIGRTITDHSYFRDMAAAGQESLYRVLRAYAVYNHKVAYCQGMSYVAGAAELPRACSCVAAFGLTMLCVTAPQLRRGAGMFMCQGVNEEQAFWMLRQFMNSEKYNLCGLYEDGFPLMQRYLENLSELLQNDYSAVYQHVCVKHGVMPVRAQDSSALRVPFLSFIVVFCRPLHC